MFIFQSESAKVFCMFFLQFESSKVFCMFFSFTFEIWLALDTGYSSGPYPIFCSEESTVCVWVEDSHVRAVYGDSGVTVESTALTEGQWHNVIYRYSMEGKYSNKGFEIG